MKVLLFQLDGKIPNLALMRIAAHHRALADEVSLRVAGNYLAIERHLGEYPDKVYASAIFTRSRALAERLLQIYPGAIVGGSGWDDAEDGLVQINTDKPEPTSLEKIGIVTHRTDYSVYPEYQNSIGFTQRGCRFTKGSCTHCSVPTREGKNRAEDAIYSIWRGDPWPKNLLLLDNDTFGNPNWRQEIAAIREGAFKVCWNQGINARMLTDEVCEAISSVDYRDDGFKTKRLYTAWDNISNETPLFRGLNALKRYGVKPDNIMVYMLIGFKENAEDREHRRLKLREFGARPYPMPYIRTKETVGFQRWVVGAYDKRISWRDWERAGYRPENLGYREDDSRIAGGRLK